MLSSEETLVNHIIVINHSLINYKGRVEIGVTCYVTLSVMSTFISLNSSRNEDCRFALLYLKNSQAVEGIYPWPGH